MRYCPYARNFSHKGSHVCPYSRKFFPQHNRVGVPFAPSSAPSAKPNHYFRENFVTMQPVFDHFGF